MASLDLTRLLPPQYRDKTLDTLLRNLFNRHLSKTDVVPLFGHAGDQLNLGPGDVQIRERDLERQINQLTSIIFAEHGTERLLSSWPDIIQKLVLLGVDYTKLDEWFKSNSYNFVPPIDLDKFCNFNQYFWIGPWIISSPSLPYHELGIPAVGNITPAFAISNESYFQEYYVIKRGELDVSFNPISPQPTLTSWSDWALANLWVHRDDIISFLSVHGGSVSFGDLTQATRPIIEYSDKLKLNTFQTVLSVPADSGTNTGQIKRRYSQLPLFDLYHFDGTHTNQASAVFYYQEGSQYPVDSAISRRIAVDANNDFIFEHSLINTETNQLRFYKSFNGSTYDLKTIWRRGPEEAIKYSKYETSGTIINQDKFVNFKNYYWIGIDSTLSHPSYNLTGLPEYTVIESSGTSGWSQYNYWVHVSQLKRTDLPKYVQAVRPIIEFNKSLESELVGAKTAFEQLPKFNLYRFNDISDVYELIPSPGAPNLIDAYLTGHLFARIEDLPSKDAILTTPEILSLCFEFNNEFYMQGLYSGEFDTTLNGIVYGYLGREVSKSGVGNGVIGSITTDPSCTPEILYLTATSPTTFSVVGSVSGSQGTLTVGTPFSASGANFTIFAGTTPFAVDDTFVIEIKSYVFNKASVFVKLDGVYRTLTSPSTIITEKQSSVIIDSDPANLDGIWEVPLQIQWNVQNETRAVIGQGDLYYHLTSIIGAQSALVGTATGDNNWRTIVPDVGLGGTIKQFDGNAALLVSMLIQKGITPNTLIEFARRSYDQLFTSIHEFVTTRVPDLLTAASFTPPTSGDSLDASVIAEFKDYFANISQVISSSASKVDDYITTPFFDSTSSIQNLVVTLPYMGLLPKVLPKKVFDLEMNMPMVVHHDGHRSPYASVSGEILKSIVTKKFERSPGQETPGSISGVTPPTLPYKGQFWFKTSTGELYFYNVVSDTGEQPTSVAGTYSYDRQTNTLTQYNGSAWVAVVNLALPWTLVDLGLIETNLLLAIEQELFDNCPVLASRLNTATLESNTNFDTYQQEEFERFGVTYGVTDVYSTVFDSNNAFTWNYKAITAPGASGPFASYLEIYRDVYGTPRPDLEPWVTCGFANESIFLTAAIIGGYLPLGTTTFVPSTMWTAIAPFVHIQLVLLSKPNKLSVDPATGILLPPYSTHVEGLTTTVPSSAPSRFTFGDLGPIETYWRKTLNFLYSRQKSYFRIDPLTWMQECWGVKYQTVGEYVLQTALQNKESAESFMLHGDSLPDAPQLSLFDATVVSNPPSAVTYVFSCVSRIDGIFKLTGTGITTPVFITSTYSNAYLSLNILSSLRGFFWGDTFTITINSDGTTVKSLTHYDQFRAEGFNQLYVQYSRMYGDDLAVSINKNLFKNWKIKLGYRFGGFVNTDALKISSNDIPVVDTSFNLYVKENKYYNSSWIDALRVQLVQRGSTDSYLGYDIPSIGPGGTPGEDWIFRVDNFNPSRPEISWYEFDTAGESSRFVALDGKRTLYNWERFKTTTTVKTFNAPFLISGIQNVLNFIFGFGDLRAAEGWEFNDRENPVLDSSTGLPIGFQLLAEKFIAQQFSGAVAGSAFIFNPFSRKVWYRTPRGVVGNLFESIGLEQETVPAILDAQHRQLSKRDVRVFRQDDVTEIVFDQPAYTLHILTSEYEHVVLFENYSAGTLIYDSFLGQRTGDVFFDGQKQTLFTGRIDFGGHFLLGDQMKRNIESSVQSILGLYDTTSTLATPDEKEHARALLGFQQKQYFADRGTPEQTEFRFWQGMIANKGTNFSVDAYVNSQRFKSAKLDEYWAYRIAEYGDAHQITKTELHTEPGDCTSELTNYLFLESDELGIVDDYQVNGGYDVTSFNDIPFDAYSIYSSDQAGGMEFFDARGSILVPPEDEARWFRYDDLKSFSYFTADVIAEWRFTPTIATDCYIVRDANGGLVRADCFELVDTTFVGAAPRVYYERGDYIPATNPPEYSSPKFKRLNASTIQILDPALNGVALKVIAYGPAASKYSPNVLYNFQSNTTAVDDIIWWDPARGIHHPQAYREVDYDQVVNPARYNVSDLAYKNTNLETQKPWGEKEVGKLWWDKTNLSWKFYSDAKLYTDLHERLARWGSISDYSKIAVNEWIQSSISPQEYEKKSDADGKLAVKNLLSRTRSWWQRPIAWKYSVNPSLFSRSFLAYQPDKLKISVVNGRGTAVLKTGDFAALGFVKDTKISGALYSSNVKTDANLTSIFGLAKVVDGSTNIVLGATTNYDEGPILAASASLSSLEIIPDSGVLSFRDGALGQYTLANTNVGAKYFLTLTHVPSGDIQTIEVHDVPVIANTNDVYEFDKLGITVQYSATFDASVGTLATRVSDIAVAIGNATHDIVLRSSIDIVSPIEFNNGITVVSTFDSNADATASGWIAWNDPATNPNQGPAEPYNNYEAFAGEWTLVGTALSDIIDDIKLRTGDKWVWFDNTDFTPYKYTLAPWKLVSDEIRSAQYVGSTAIFAANFTFSATRLELLKRTDVYVNGVILKSSSWRLVPSGADFYVEVLSPLKLGDFIRVVVRKYSPTEKELAFDPSVSDENPLLMTQWKYDYPHVYEEKRANQGSSIVKNYYFWVTDRTAPAVHKNLGTRKIAQLLGVHDGIYSVPQVFKFYNQLDARPNRYGMLSLRNLGRYVKVGDTYKLRLTKNPTLRDSDSGMSLKNVHVEWELLRQYQPTKISKVLWDLLTDTLAGETSLGQVLPFELLQSYDDRNNTAVRYGFNNQQVLVDPEVARATLKYTILNTRVDKYLNGKFVIDFISYPGFDASLLDTYLLTTANIRKFMSDLWRFAKPKQINEIFFAVLEDAAEANLQLTDFFKTSFISLNDVRTIDTQGS